MRKAALPEPIFRAAACEAALQQARAGAVPVAVGETGVIGRASDGLYERLHKAAVRAHDAQLVRLLDSPYLARMPDDTLAAVLGTAAQTYEKIGTCGLRSAVWLGEAGTGKTASLLALCYLLAILRSDLLVVLGTTGWEQAMDLAPGLEAALADGRAVRAARGGRTEVDRTVLSRMLVETKQGGTYLRQWVRRHSKGGKRPDIVVVVEEAFQAHPSSMSKLVNELRELGGRHAVTLILVGDPMQLPPAIPASDRATWEAYTRMEMVPQGSLLSHFGTQLRQRSDTRLADTIAALRTGAALTAETARVLEQTAPRPGVSELVLVERCDQAREINMRTVCRLAEENGRRVTHVRPVKVASFEEYVRRVCITNLYPDLVYSNNRRKLRTMDNDDLLDASAAILPGLWYLLHGQPGRTNNTLVYLCAVHEVGGVVFYHVISEQSLREGRPVVTVLAPVLMVYKGALYMGPPVRRPIAMPVFSMQGRTLDSQFIAYRLLRRSSLYVALTRVLHPLQARCLDEKIGRIGARYPVEPTATSAAFNIRERCITSPASDDACLNLLGGVAEAMLNPDTKRKAKRKRADAAAAADAPRAKRTRTDSGPLHPAAALLVSDPAGDSDPFADIM